MSLSIAAPGTSFPAAKTAAWLRQTLAAIAVMFKKENVHKHGLRSDKGAACI